MILQCGQRSIPKSNSIVACFSARCARTHYQGIVCFRHMACYPTVPIFFGSNCSHSLLRVLHTYCRFLCLPCLRYFSFARCARPHAQVIVGCRHVSSTRAGRLLYLSYLLYFPSVRCARTHSQSVIGCRHVSSTRAVGFLFVIIFFSSLRSHSHSVCQAAGICLPHVLSVFAIFFFGWLRSHPLS